MAATKILLLCVLASTEAIFLDKKIYLINKLKHKLGHKLDHKLGHKLDHKLGMTLPEAWYDN